MNVNIELLENFKIMKGIFLSHGHESNMGAISDILLDLPDIKVYGGKFTLEIIKQDLEEAGIKYPIKVEYYKIINEEEKIKQNKSIYGIQVIKTEYKDKIGVEQEKIEHITNDEKEITKMLNLIKNGEVTPIGLEDVIIEIKNRQAIAKNKKLSYNT